VLEISSKSDEELGKDMSAFNLKFQHGGVECTVESVYQASKVFDGGIGPFPKLYSHDSREVRNFVQEKSKGHRLIGFDFDGDRWELRPETAFYNWLYIHALLKNPELAKKVEAYDAFTDIEFNPNEGINCQAAATAFYISLCRTGRLKEAMDNRNLFVQFCPRIEPAKKSPLRGVAGATRYSLITGLMDSPTNQKWNIFLSEGPYWNYLVNYITTKKIFGGRKDLVEEAVQLAITKIGKFMVSKQYKYHEEGKGFFRGFIKKVAYRAALDVFRQNMRYEKVSDRSSPSDSDTIEKDYKKSYDNNAKKLAKMGEQVGIDSEIVSVSENDLDNYDVSAGFKRNIKPEIKSGAGKKMHNIARLDSDPFTDDEMPSNYSPADIFDYLTNISKEDLKWVQKLQLHVLYIALGYVLANKDISADRREMLRLRYGCDWKVSDIYASERFKSLKRSAFDAKMSHATDELQKEAESWWEMVAPAENDFADETVLNLWRKLSSDHNRAQIANDLQDKANEKAGRIG
jgi:hypothetical protein